MVYTSILPHYSDSEGSDQLETLTLYGVENAACGSFESGLFGCGGGHILVRHTGIGAGRWRSCHRACKHTEASNQYARGSPKVTEPNDTKHDQSCARLHVQSAEGSPGGGEGAVTDEARFEDLRAAKTCLFRVLAAGWTPIDPIDPMDPGRHAA